MLKETLQQRAGRAMAPGFDPDQDVERTLDLAKNASLAVSEYGSNAGVDDPTIRVSLEQIAADIDEFSETDPLVSRIIQAVPELGPAVINSLREYETGARRRLIEPLDNNVRIFVYRQLATELLAADVRGHMIDEELRKIVLANGDPPPRLASLPRSIEDDSRFGKSSFDLGIALGDPSLGIHLNCEATRGEWQIKTKRGETQQGFFNDPPRWISGSSSGYNWYLVPGATFKIAPQKMGDVNWGKGKLKGFGEIPELAELVLTGIELPCVMFYAERPFSNEKILFRLCWIDANSEVRAAFVTGKEAPEQLGNIQEGFDYRDFRSLCEHEYGLPQEKLDF